MKVTIEFELPQVAPATVGSLVVLQRQAGSLVREAFPNAGKVVTYVSIPGVPV
jgi:hypothetical protein